MLKRESLRNQIKGEIRRQIISGDLTAKKRLSEVELASELGVSRTPLREALISLEQEGFLCASPGRGFSILPLSEDEYKQLVPVIGALERIALLSCPLPNLKKLEELRLINLDLLATDKIKDKDRRSEERVKTDMMWHEVLLENAKNLKALDLVMKTKLQWQRYEYAFWTALDDVSQSAANHSKIIDHLTNKSMINAADELDLHWSECCKTEIYLQSREK